jgi:hypothetical protein
MTQGFYELLGVASQATTDEIRSAYARLVAHIMRRREALIDRGGDTATLDLARAQADEAWGVLSTPSRRRRYDAMVALTMRGVPDDVDTLWAQAAGAMVRPTASSAAELVRQCTTLAVGSMPPIARPVASTPAHHRPARPEGGPLESPDLRVGTPSSRGHAPTAVPTDTQVPTDFGLPRHTDPGPPSHPGLMHDVPTAPPATHPGAEVVRLRGHDAGHVPAHLQVVDGTPAASPVIVLPKPDVERRRAVSSEDVARMVDQHGYGGTLLRSMREARDITLQQMSDTTRISVKYLEAVERDDYLSLPSATFVRGYVREMTRLLGLDERRTVPGYMRRYHDEG